MNRQSPSGKVFRVVVLAFTGVDAARQAFDDARAGGLLNGFRVASEAIVERDSGGEVTVHESGRGRLGAAMGVVGGGVLSLLGGPLGLFWMLVGGGVTGGLIGHFAGRAVPADQLKKVGNLLTNDSSGIFLLLEDKEAEKAIAALGGIPADVVTIDLGDELSGVVAETVVADVAADKAGNAG